MNVFLALKFLSASLASVVGFTFISALAAFNTVSRCLSAITKLVSSGVQVVGGLTKWNGLK
jgi:hypothetical protein